jgi:hypothetical protein
MNSERHPIAQAFRRPDAPPPQQTTRVLRKASLVVTEIHSEYRDRLVTGTLPQDDAYIVTMHLRRRPNGGMAAEGRWLQPSNFYPGHAGIVDLRMKLVSEYVGPFHYLSFYLTREALEAFGDERPIRRSRGDGVRHAHGAELRRRPTTSSTPARRSCAVARAPGQGDPRRPPRRVGVAGRTGRRLPAFGQALRAGLSPVHRPAAPSMADGAAVGMR